MKAKNMYPYEELSSEKNDLLQLYLGSKKDNPWPTTIMCFPSPQQNKELICSVRRKNMAQLSLHPIQLSVLCGTCLGDSSLKIQKGYSNARIQCRHSTQQAAWFFWKWMVCLRSYHNGLQSITFQPPDGYQLNKINSKDSFMPKQFYGKLKITTSAIATLTALHGELCDRNQIRIRRKWLNHMNNYFLMTLWLDDGSLYNQRQGVFCLDSTPYDQQIVLSTYLKKVWGIHCEVRVAGKKMRNGQMPYRLFIRDQESLLQLLRLIAPLIPVKQMLYKIRFVPKNNLSLLQRWASEVVNLVQVEFKEQLRSEYSALIEKAHQKKI